jgi:stage V sporulation protein K
MVPPEQVRRLLQDLISKAFKNLGSLKKGHLVETERSQLVAGYVGQTAIKTKEILDRALDGVLFIDEAYSLNSKDDYGKEAM